MTVRRPLVELDLRHELRLEPAALFHLLRRERPLRAFLLRQVGEGALLSRPAIQTLKDLTADVGHKSVSHLGDEVQPCSVVASHDQRIERMAARVTADNELLRPMNLVLEPRAATLAGLIQRTFALCDDALNLSLLGGTNQAAGSALKGIERSTG